MTQSEMMNWVHALELTLLPCLPARELQAIDRSAHPSHQADVERHVKEFMEAAKKLQTFFIRLQYQYQPSREETLKKEIDSLEAELKEKDELVERQKKLLQGWQDLLQAQKAAHTSELKKV